MRSRHGRAVFTDPTQLCSALGIAFSDQQLEAITAPLEPGVIIAGAGSGKTTVMAARVVWLVGRGLVTPDEVLGLTFTRKAAAELSSRIRSALVSAGMGDNGTQPEPGEQVVMTYDAFAARLVADHGLLMGVENDQTMLTGAGRFRLAARIVAAASGPFERLSRLRPDTVTERVVALDAEIQSHLLTQDDLDRHAARFVAALHEAPLNRGKPYKAVVDAELFASERAELVGLAQEFQQLKLSLGIVEFADQMALAARLATRIPAVGAHIRKEFRVVLLDEYQDTSAAQAALLRGLFSGSAEHGLGHPVTAVGDPFQAIYGWRGAAASNIVEFAADFPRVDGPAASFPLTVNRRSGPEILATANQVAEPLRSDRLVAMDLTGASLVAAPEAPAASVWSAGFATWPEEVDWICDQVVALHHGSVATPWRQIAILARRNADLGALYAGLRRRDVPAEIVGLGGLLSLPEVTDVVETLRVIDDPTANPALIRLLTGPRWAVGPGDLAALGARAHELSGRPPPTSDGDLAEGLAQAVRATDDSETVSLAEALSNPGSTDLSPQGRVRCAALADELAYLRRHADEPVDDLVRRVISVMHLDVEASLNQAEDRPWGSQLDRFCDVVAGYGDVDGDSSLAGLLAYLDAERDRGGGLDIDVPRSTDAVQVLTIHKAKGLEWDAVFVPDLAAKVFPSDRTTGNWLKGAASLPPELRGDRRSIPQLGSISKQGMDDYAEDLRDDHRRSEDRLAYVAFTRARRLLVGSHHTWRPGLSTPRHPSPYYEILRQHAVSLGTAWCEAPPPAQGNPQAAEMSSVPWPAVMDTAALEERRMAARWIEQARSERATTGAYPTDDVTTLDDSAVIAEWDVDLGLLNDEAQRMRTARTVTLGSSLSVSDVVSAHRDPDAYAQMLARPMPRHPSHRAALGRRFHEWVQHRLKAATPLVDSDTVGDVQGVDGEFRAICEAFAAGRFADQIPLALESPFSMWIGGVVVRGRIDAVFAGTKARTYVVVDWKTGEDQQADPLQLACYRLAWADAMRVDPDHVTAGFYYVRSDRFVTPRLPDRRATEGLVAALGRDLNRPT